MAIDNFCGGPINTRELTIYLGNLNGDVLRNKRVVYAEQRKRIISSPNGLINNILVL